MKCPIFPALWPKVWLCLLWAVLECDAARAQNGVTVYSDTVSVLEDVAGDSAWNSSPSVYSRTFSLMGNPEDEGFLDFLSGFLGVGGVLLAIFTVILFLLPVLLAALAVWLIYRSRRKRNARIERIAFDPEKRTVDEDMKNRLLKQSAIKNACWGVGLIVVGLIVDFTVLLHVAGVVMLCMATGDWLATLVKKKEHTRHQE